MNICVIIPAAGRGTRFGRDDKLARELSGRPVLMRSIEPFTRREEVGSIIVAGPPEDFDTFRERYGAALGFHGATLVEGGRSDRWETVRAALSHVPEEATHVAVHDAARPLVDDELLDRLFAAARRLDAVVPPDLFEQYRSLRGAVAPTPLCPATRPAQHTARAQPPPARR